VAPGEAFLFEPLFYLVGELDYEYLMLWESDLIRVNNSVVGGYNARESSGRGRAPGAEFGAAISRALAKPEEKARRSAASKMARNDPEAKRKHAEKMRAWHAENKEQVLARNRASAELTSVITKRAMHRPDVVAKMAAANARPDVRLKRSESAKRLLSDPAVRKQRSDQMKRVWAERKQLTNLMYGTVTVTKEVTV
jgi:hypothetical protein